MEARCYNPGNMAERLAVPRQGGARTPTDSLTEASEHAGLASRVFAFAIDSLALLALTLLFAAAAFLNVYLRTDQGQGRLDDSTAWTLVAVLMAVVPVWILVNAALQWRRGQTLGQYVAGLGVTNEQGESPGPVRVLLYLLALHPLAFHPFLVPSWLFLVYTALTVTNSTPLVIASFALVLLCVVAPVVAFVSAAGDGHRRALHDRIAGMLVVRLE